MGLVAFIMAYALFAFIFYILQVIAYWKIFTKAGEEGWKSIIPIYNGYVQYRLTCVYGHGIGFTIGLFFLNPLFMLILGFGDSEYMGPQE